MADVLTAEQEVAKLREAIAYAGYSVMQTTGRWSIHDISEYARRDEERTDRVLDEAMHARWALQALWDFVQRHRVPQNLAEFGLELLKAQPVFAQVEQFFTEFPESCESWKRPSRADDLVATLQGLMARRGQYAAETLLSHMATKIEAYVASNEAVKPEKVVGNGDGVSAERGGDRDGGSGPAPAAGPLGAE